MSLFEQNDVMMTRQDGDSSRRQLFLLDPNPNPNPDPNPNPNIIPKPIILTLILT